MKFKGCISYYVALVHSSTGLYNFMTFCQQRARIKQLGRSFFLRRINNRKYIKYNNSNEYPKILNRDQCLTFNREMTESELHQNLQFFPQNIRKNLD